MSEDKQRSRPVPRSQAVTKANYDRLSRWYDLIAGWSERKAVACGLKQLHALEGETVIEIGYGTGRVLVALARAVGETGCVVGVDLSEGMHRVAARRVEQAGLSDRVDLICGDATFLAAELKRNATLPLSLKHPEGMRDAIFMSFTLELFDEAEIPIVLSECRQALRPGGRIAVVSMQKKTERGLMVRLYEWAHDKMPKLVDCRPIHADRALTEAGLQVTQQTEITMWRLPVSVVLAKKQ